MVSKQPTHTSQEDFTKSVFQTFSQWGWLPGVRYELRKSEEPVVFLFCRMCLSTYYIRIVEKEINLIQSNLWQTFVWKWGLTVARGEDVMPHRSTHTMEWNQKKICPSNEETGYKALGCILINSHCKTKKSLFSLELCHSQHHVVMWTCLEREWKIGHLPGNISERPPSFSRCAMYQPFTNRKSWKSVSHLTGKSSSEHFIFGTFQVSTKKDDNQFYILSLLLWSAILHFFTVLNLL